MASSLQLLLIFSVIISSFAHKPTSQNTLILPLTKDPSTHQYLTHLYTGTPMAPTKLVVDLSGPFLWLDCASRHVSLSHRPIPTGSLQCSRAKATTGCGSGRSCTLNTVNTITRAAARGDLAEDILTVERVERSVRIATVDRFLFSCAPPLLVNGLASGTKGMLGLGRGRISLPSQIATSFGSIHRKFAACLSSNDGFIVSGKGVPLLRSDASNSLTYTPLISNQEGTLEDYYINVKSIKINGKRLSLNTSKLSMDHEGKGGTKLSTIVPYTTMETTIYETFTKAYVTAAAATNMTRVASVAPFGVCFSSSDGVDETRVGPAVPAVDLVMQSEMVRWRIHGRNSMVEVSEGVMCLGFVDGGSSPDQASIVMGGYQLEDHLLEFDLGASMFGFSSSLLVRESSCSDFLHSMPRESL
ncbi:probable aspartic proteinase GIP2 [Rhododendron vialii]|uniref:probable aspartic proteinase GIP2 n=1 Tax=Rhododendron vialii TaxID=182163 RepID=UPI00265F6843|nr:probable aspartic proteinase GIP2 [Rhododendron vialii]